MGRTTSRAGAAPARSRWWRAVLAVGLWSCENGSARASETATVDRNVSPAVRDGGAQPAIPVMPLKDDTPLSLARAAGANGYVVDDSLHEQPGGALAGDVIATGKLPPDSVVVPRVDTNECRPFEETTITRRGKGLGQAVVWLVGVTHGPRDTTSRRILLRMDRCRLSPRVQRAPQGATLNLGLRDAMLTRFAFRDVDDSTHRTRAIIALNDAGQVVPTSEALARPGLVEVRDELHPWARAFVAVAPHPFVATTAPDGKFIFEHVPEGSYVLVAWHERLGARSQPVRVTAGGTLKVTVEY